MAHLNPLEQESMAKAQQHAEREAKRLEQEKILRAKGFESVDVQ